VSAAASAWPYDLFVSHAEPDRAWVEGYLLPELGLGSRALTPARFRLAASLRDEIRRAVTSSRFTLLVLSPAFTADEWSSLTEQLASYLNVTEQQARIIPLLKSRFDLPLSLAYLVPLDCTKEENWKREIGRLRELLDQPEPEPERIECPYPGLRPFRRGDPHFFGREPEVWELVARLRNERRVYVTGPSGSGKTSLICAGLIPELEKQQPGAWAARVISCRDDPEAELAAALGGAAPAQREAAAYARVVAAALEQCRPPASSLLLVIDDFESVLDSPDEPPRAAFLSALECLARVRQCALVFLCDRAPPGVENAQCLQLSPVAGAGLRDAIVRPSEEAGLHLEPALVERLLADVEDQPGAMPALQETLSALWGSRARCFLPLSAYERLARGGNGAAAALARKADGVLAEMEPDQKTIARRIFLRLLDFGEGRAEACRRLPRSRLRSSDEDAARFDETLDALKLCYLLVAGRTEGDSEPSIAIAHGELPAEWTGFREWMAERRAPELLRRRLEARAEAGELLTGSELAQARQWLAGPHAAELGYPADFVRLIEASERAGRRRWYVKAAAMALFAAVLGLAAYSYSRYVENRRAALADRMAAEALGRVSSDREIALRLALRAAAVTRAVSGTVRPEPLRALHAAMQEYALPIRLSGQPVRIAFHPQPGMVVIAGRDPDTGVWGWESRKKILEAPPAVASAVSRDGRRLALQTPDGAVVIMETGMERRTIGLPAAAGELTAVALSPDSARLATAYTSGSVRLWSASGEPAAELSGHNDAVMAVAFSGDSRLLAAAGWEGQVSIWEAQPGRLLRRLPVFQEAAADLAFRVGTHQLAAASNTHDEARVWDADAAKQLFVISHGDPAAQPQTEMGEAAARAARAVKAVAYSPDGQRIATAGGDGTARLWDAASGTLLRTLPCTEPGAALDVAFSPDAKRLAVACDGRTVRSYILDPEELFQSGVRILGDRLSPEEKQDLLRSSRR
jgi:hypothetical protein